jgi:hypothetical protein
MGIFNKRNAVLGWLTWSVGKRVVKKKAKAVVPEKVMPSTEPAAAGKGKAVKGVAVLAGALGALAFWKKSRRRGGGDSDEPGSSAE